MKELEIISKDKTEIVANQKKQVEHQLIGRMIPYNGHKIWEINIETGEISEAKFSNNTYMAFGENKKEILVKKHCVYISALNKKNALKKADKGNIGAKLYF